MKPIDPYAARVWAGILLALGLLAVALFGCEPPRSPPQRSTTPAEAVPAAAEPVDVEVENIDRFTRRVIDHRTGFVCYITRRMSDAMKCFPFREEAAGAGSD